MKIPFTTMLSIVFSLFFGSGCSDAIITIDDIANGGTIYDTLELPAGEYKIQKALDVLMKGKTVIMIAHRLSTVTGADHIIVLNEGRIDESGSHGTLMQKDGLYSKMFREYQTSTTWKIGGEAHA